MTKINHVRIYPNPDRAKGFDVILRVRGGIQKHGTYPTIEAAFAASWALDGRKPGDPIYVYENDFPASLTAHIVPALAKMAEG